MKNVKKVVVATPVNSTIAEDTAKTAVKETAKVEKASAVVSEKVAPAKEAAQKKDAKKTAVKKTTAKKTATKKTETKESLHIEFSGKSYSKETLMKSVKDIWKYDYKKKVSDLKSIELYVKPEEGKAYYVINGEVLGDFII